jgi:hypothetical protein
LKIIARDNFDRELPGKSDERLVAAQVPTHFASRIVELLNGAEPDDSPDYFVAMDDEYVLKKYEP